MYINKTEELHDLYKQRFTRETTSTFDRNKCTFNKEMFILTLHSMGQYDHS